MGLNEGGIMGCGADLDRLSMTTSTDPTANAATTSTIIGAFAGVVITTTTTGNSQTLASPTDTTAGKVFTVVNNDTSTNTVPVVANSVTYTIAVGTGQSFVWDGSKWMPTSMGITAIPVTVAQGGTGRATGTSAYALVATGTTATGNQQSLAVGATTEILVGGGVSAVPVWTTATGSGAPVRATSPVLVTPALGTPASGDLSNCTLSTPPAIGGTTANTVQRTQKIIDGSTGLTLSAAQVSDTIISNTGQGVADVNHALPTAAAGYHFKAIIGETQGANYFRFTRSGSDTIIADGVTGKTYINEVSPTQGDQLELYTLQVASTGIKTGAALAIGTTKTNVANGAFTFDIDGAGYAKAATAAGTAPGNDVIPQNKYGAVAFDIGADGTIDAVEATDNATGYDTALLAVAGLPAVGASHTRMGYVTAMKSDGTFTFGTTDFDATNTTVAYTSSTAYTKPYAWIAETIQGTWATD